MLSIGNNVFSLYGARITEVPEYRDKRGPRVFFAAQMRDMSEPVMLQGNETVFGLVMHRLYLRPTDPPVWIKWVISEPTTGASVASGNTRRCALEDLAWKVAFYGGETAFKRMLTDAVRRAHMGAEATAPAA